jgi:hypothetical protein
VLDVGWMQRGDTNTLYRHDEDLDLSTVDLPGRIATILGPHLGPSIADSVARHLCAKHEIGDGVIEASRSERLRETLRRGLVAFVGAEQASKLADECLAVGDGEA